MSRTRRGENETIKIALEWKSQEKISGESRKRWIDMVEKDLRILAVEDWRILQDRDRWNSVVMVVKTL